MTFSAKGMHLLVKLSCSQGGKLGLARVDAKLGLGLVWLGVELLGEQIVEEVLHLVSVDGVVVVASDLGGCLGNC